MHRTISAGPDGDGSPRSDSHETIRAGMSPGGRNTGSSASMTNRSGGTEPAAASSDSSDPAAEPQHRTHSCSSHSPVTLRRYLTVPSIPASLVKLASRLASDSTGAVSSSPASDHVPEEM
jgi:hypothetical protein